MIEDVKFQSLAQKEISSAIKILVESITGDKGDLPRALQQRLVSKYLSDFYKIYAIHGDLKGKFFRFEDSRVLLSKKKFHSFSGKLVWGNYFLFLKHLAGLNFFVARYFFSNKSKFKSINIFLASDINHFLKIEDIERVQEFLNKINNTAISDSDLLIVEDPVFETRSDKIFFTKSYLKKIIQITKFSFFEALFLICKSISISLRFGYLCFKTPILSFLAKDESSQPFVSFFNHSGLIKHIYYSNSRINIQERWMFELSERRFDIHLLWYSLNSTGLNYIEDEMRAPHPMIKLLKADHSWSWSDAFNEWVKKNTYIKKVHLTYPLVWDTSTGKIINRDVVIFDVTPVVRSKIDEMFSEKFFYYYSAERMIQFIEGIVDARDKICSSTGKSIKIFLKHKRKYHVIHDKRYIDFIEKLSNLGSIEILDSYENIIDLIDGTHLVFVAPYSSPAEIAKYLGKKAFYYDPTGLLKKSDNELLLVSNFEVHEQMEKVFK